MNNVKRKIVKRIFSYIIEKHNNVSDEYASYMLRPKKANNFVQKRITNLSDKVGVILQGPILEVDDFTIESIKLYKKTLSNSIIIVSTWDDINRKTYDDLMSLGVEVVLSTKPLNNGIQNINLQVCSTMAGIKRAEEIGCKYILKTRTDQRFYKSDLDSFFISLLEIFPVNNRTAKEKITGRVVLLQGTIGINIFLPFYLSDFLYFGYLKDIKNIFSYPLDSESYDSETQREYIKESKGLLNEGDFLRRIAPEVKIMESYVKNYIDKDFEYNVKFFWEIMKKYFITVSNEEIGFYWPKYKNMLFENNITLNYLPYSEESSMSTESWSFCTWLNLYSGRLKYDKSYERYKMRSVGNQ